MSQFNDGINSAIADVRAEERNAHNKIISGIPINRAISSIGKNARRSIVSPTR